MSIPIGTASGTIILRRARAFIEQLNPEPFLRNTLSSTTILPVREGFGPAAAEHVWLCAEVEFQTKGCL